MRIRPVTGADVHQITRIFYETIHRVNLGDYTREQVEAWAPEVPSVDRWTDRLPARLTLVADNDGQIAGFGELKPDGHIDCFYCHHAWQRRGVGSRIYHGLEAAARSQGLTRLFTEASLTARPFFERMGFRVLQQRTVVCRGVSLTNFAMEKHLDSPPAVTPTGSSS